MDYGKAIKKFRKKHKLSQNDLAQKLHVSRKTISSWENSRNKVSMDYIHNINQIYDDNINYYCKNSSNSTIQIKMKQLFNLSFENFLFKINLILLLLLVINIFTSQFKSSIFVEILFLCLYLIFVEKNINSYLPTKFHITLMIIIFITLDMVQFNKVYVSFHNSNVFYIFLFAGTIKVAIATLGIYFLTCLKTGKKREI
ncbi:helix-turn-helix domain-containing protein [Apilactobacillus xinyiensis]|uniref:helix-turn-helix domain-containing protein n=1 Tax=Apilactobacillus xinyiensis TaxID=2841032 RepID=UPI001C7DCF4B|nr:helix-turn-helix transcriptional regulator [Apilactobacillus xinyiensis]